ncbi:hypothetical protein [Paraburkholderia acidipaludis]|uniref:hypothetical protein n=1 Tax=Paraburkholderia acidipaludis TaxID=660537 RepID=UPI000482F6E8|nr:hypothetical protein [Paraburkholderia acidipaludis]
MGTLKVVEDVFVGLTVAMLFVLVELSATNSLTSMRRNELPDRATGCNGAREKDPAGTSDSP